MGKAEDAIRRRMRQVEEDKDKDRRSAEARAARLRPLVGPAVKAALERLEAKGFPGAQLVVEKKSFGRSRERACWSLRAGTQILRGDILQNYVLLMSDGTIETRGRGEYYNKKLYNPVPGMSEEGLTELLSDLRALGK